VIVVDASVIVAGLADDGTDGDRARDRLRGENLVAPHLIDLEVLSAWRRVASKGGLDDRRYELAVHDLLDMPMRRIPHWPMLARCWQLRENLSTYDAVYVALAETLGLTLVTADARLARAPGTTCEVEVLAS
jgi:predicted nucleic acid-binding protein